MIIEGLLIVCAALSGALAMALRRDDQAQIAFGVHALIMAGVAQRIAGGWVAALWGLLGAALLLHALTAPRGDRPSPARRLTGRNRWALGLSALAWVALVMPLAVNYWPGETYATPMAEGASSGPLIPLIAAFSDYALAIIAVALTLLVAASAWRAKERP